MKYKIIKNLPEISDAEIQSKADFQKVLDKRSVLASSKKAALKSWLKGIALTSSVILLVVVFINIRESENTDKQTFIAPLGKLDDKIEYINPKDTESKEKNSKLTEAKEPIKQHKETIIAETAKVIPIEEKNDSIKSLEIVINREAEPIIGFDSLQKYLNKNIAYPQSALEQETPPQGTVDVLFTIDTIGRATKIKVINSLGEEFDKQAVILLENMPEWRPAIMNDKKIESQLSIPLSFKIEKKKE